jgi:hypothetical protein
MKDRKQESFYEIIKHGKNLMMIRAFNGLKMILINPKI